MQLIVSAFDAAEQAAQVTEVLRELDRRDHAIHLGNLAVVRRDADGQIVFEEREDRRAQLGRVAGAVVGGVTEFIYSFAGMLGAPAGIYAADQTEQAVQRLVRDSGFPDDALYAIGERLGAGQSALIVLARAAEAPAVIAELTRLGGELRTHELPAEVVAALQQG